MKLSISYRTSEHSLTNDPVLLHFRGTIIQWRAPQLDVFLKYAKVELTPPTPGDIPAIRQSIVKEAWLNTLVTAEVIFWFYIGECIGKRHLVGYNV
ncbi:hypothetical protein ACLKA7_004334 [Drosophila subpalustris]